MILGDSKEPKQLLWNTVAKQKVLLLCWILGRVQPQGWKLWGGERANEVRHKVRWEFPPKGKTGCLTAWQGIHFSGCKVAPGCFSCTAADEEVNRLICQQKHNVGWSEDSRNSVHGVALSWFLVEQKVNSYIPASQTNKQKLKIAPFQTFNLKRMYFSQHTPIHSPIQWKAFAF